jgi:hypothetical protein
VAYPSGLAYNYQAYSAPVRSSTEGGPAKLKPAPTAQPAAQSAASSPDRVQLSSGSQPSEGQAMGQMDNLRRMSQQRSAPKLPEETSNNLAKNIIDTNTSWGNLDEDKVGANLSNFRTQPQVIDKVLNGVSDSDRDDISERLAAHLTDDQLKQMASTPEGVATMKKMIGHLNTGSVSQDETTQIQRLGKYSATKHGRLLDDTISQPVKDSLNKAGMTHQPISEGNGRINFDEYSVTIDKMPPGVTPQDFLDKFADNPNKTVNSDGVDNLGEFSRRNPGSPAAPGAIYDIDMAGPENGSVVMKDKQPGSITLSTIDGDKYGEHPIYGNREFGFTSNEDGSTTFYTRAADRMDFINGQTPLGATAASAIQSSLWNSFTEGVAKELTRQGGTVRPDSRTEYHQMQ